MNIDTIKHLVKEAHKAGQLTTSNKAEILVSDIYVENLFKSDLIKKEEFHVSELGIFKISDIVAISSLRNDERGISFDVFLSRNMLSIGKKKENNNTIEVDEIMNLHSRVVSEFQNCL